MSVAIVGAGVTGLSFALGLSLSVSSDSKIHIIDKKTPSPSTSESEDHRVLALSCGSQQLLQYLGVWSKIAPDATPIDRIHVSDKGHLGYMERAANEWELSALGFVVPIISLEKALLEALSKREGVYFHRPNTIVSIEREEKKTRVHLDEGKHIDCKLLVAADGTYSSVGKACYIDYSDEPLSQFAAITTIESQHAHQCQAFERFTEQGPLALLPMAGDRSAVVWCHPISKIDDVRAWSDEQFIDHLQQQMGWQLGRITNVGQRHYYHLHQRHALQLFRHRTVLIGNAAQTLHPVAGQGLNLALQDVIALQRIIALAYKEDRDIGSYSVLSAYAEQRQNQRNFMINFTRGTVSLFSNQRLFCEAVRNVGLLTLSQHRGITYALMKKMPGFIRG